MSTRGFSLAALPIARVPGVAIVLVVLCAGFGLTSPGFVTPANIANILTQSTILLLLALPMTVIIMTDLIWLRTIAKPFNAWKTVFKRPREMSWSNS